MRIDFSIDGGFAAFPGLTQPVTIECDALPAAEDVVVGDLSTIAAMRRVAEHANRTGRFDAVVHLGAVPAPGIRTDVATFHNNMSSTFNVFWAAVRLGIRRIVYASSETVLGLPFDVPPPYIPVDEDYAARPESVYSIVKVLEEQLDVAADRGQRRAQLVRDERDELVFEPVELTQAVVLLREEPLHGFGLGAGCALGLEQPPAFLGVLV